MIPSVTGEIVSNKTLSTPGYWNLNPIFLARFVVALKNLLSRSGKKVGRNLDLSHRNYFYVSMLVEIQFHSALHGPINDIFNDAQETTKWVMP